MGIRQKCNPIPVVVFRGVPIRMHKPVAIISTTKLHALRSGVIYRSGVQLRFHHEKLLSSSESLPSGKVTCLVIYRKKVLNTSDFNGSTFGTQVLSCMRISGLTSLRFCGYVPKHHVCSRLAIPIVDYSKGNELGVEIFVRAETEVNDAPWCSKMPEDIADALQSTPLLPLEAGDAVVFTRKTIANMQQSMGYILQRIVVCKNGHEGAKTLMPYEGGVSPFARDIVLPTSKIYELIRLTKRTQGQRIQTRNAPQFSSGAEENIPRTKVIAIIWYYQGRKRVHGPEAGVPLIIFVGLKELEMTINSNRAEEGTVQKTLDDWWSRTVGVDGCFALSRSRPESRGSYSYG
ncbi:hypothetical protein BC826DRAFT_970814 [Russula brevipes]|nr:hypothetical protein BC826DRAFT_970814 [Russula brevipes]